VELAKETLSDYGWWEKRLKVREARGRQRAKREVRPETESESTSR
jgi:hypothetical protein